MPSFNIIFMLSSLHNFITADFHQSCAALFYQACSLTHASPYTVQCDSWPFFFHSFLPFTSKLWNNLCLNMALLSYHVNSSKRGVSWILWTKVWSYFGNHSYTMNSTFCRLCCTFHLVFVYFSGGNGIEKCHTAIFHVDLYCLYYLMCSVV